MPIPKAMVATMIFISSRMKPLLIFLSGFGVQPSMVSGGGKPVALEIINQFSVSFLEKQ